MLKLKNLAPLVLTEKQNSLLIENASRDDILKLKMENDLLKAKLRILTENLELVTRKSCYLTFKKVFITEKANDPKSVEQEEIERLTAKIEELERELAEEKFFNEKLRLEFSDALKLHISKKSAKNILEEEEFSFSKGLLLKHQKETDTLKEV
jgi:hypothetical protein